MPARLDVPVMLRFLARMLGLLLMAGGFVVLVYDGARSIANNGVRITSLADVIASLFKDKAGAFQTGIEGAAPWLWHVLGLPLTLAPASVIGLVLGAFVLWLGQPGRETVGFLTRP